MSCIENLKHPEQRLQERVGIKPEKSSTYFDRVLRNGKDASYFGKKERQYIIDCQDKYGRKALVFGDCIFMFDRKNNEPVTVLNKPSWFNQNKHLKNHINYEDEFIA